MLPRENSGVYLNWLLTQSLCTAGWWNHMWALFCFSTTLLIFRVLLYPTIFQWSCFCSLDEKNCCIISNDCEIIKQIKISDARKHYFHGTSQKTAPRDPLTKYTQKEKVELQITECHALFLQ